VVDNLTEHLLGVTMGWGSPVPAAGISGRGSMGFIPSTSYGRSTAILARGLVSHAHRSYV
jgi:hypothetical protein